MTHFIAMVRFTRASSTEISSRQPSFGTQTPLFFAFLKQGDSQLPILEQCAAILHTFSAMACRDFGSLSNSTRSSPFLETKELGPLTQQCRSQRLALFHTPFEAAKISSFFTSLYGQVSWKPYQAEQSSLPTLQAKLKLQYNPSTIITCFSLNMPQRLSPMQQKDTSPVSGCTRTSVRVQAPDSLMDYTAYFTNLVGFCTYLSGQLMQKDYTTFNSFYEQQGSTLSEKALLSCPFPWSAIASKLGVIKMRSVPSDIVLIGCTIREEPTSKEYTYFLSLMFDTAKFRRICRAVVSIL